MMKGTPSRLRMKINTNDIGKIFVAFYDPKHKDTLPYYDQVPIIIPFAFDKTGFKSFNLHYISPYQRALIMDGLYKISGGTGDEIKKLSISYQFLKGASRFKPMMPCVKQYLWTHFRSPFFTAQPYEWDQIVQLPIARFVGATETRVFRDSMKAIK